MARDIPPRRAKLGARLRELRATRYSSGAEFAREIGWLQPKVSKIERGAQLPSPDDVEVWLRACNAEEAADNVAILLADARLERTSFAPMWSDAEGIAITQQAVLEAEGKASVIAEYQPSMVPGLAHTPAYARATLLAPGGAVQVGATSDTVEVLIGWRDQRQRQALYHPGRRVRLLMGEAALHVRFGGLDVMRGQLDRLAVLATLPSVEIGIMPFNAESPVLPLAGVALLDDRAAWVETLVGDRQVDSADDVAAYVQAFEIGMAAAVRGHDAIELIQAVAAELRQDDGGHR